jgi:membrane protein DedA with SNARE-associated domain
MNPLVETIKPYINHYGYWAIFFGVFLESVGLPLPGETLIIVAGLVAAKGILNFSWIVVLAVVATFVANNISYAAGFFGGRVFVIKYGKYVFFNDKRLLELESFVKHHGSKVVVIARFILGLRQINGLIAGTAKMPFVKFEVFNMIGAILWVGWWVGLAYYFGRRFESIFIEYYFLIGVLALLVLVILACCFARNKNISPKNQPV